MASKKSEWRRNTLDRLAIYNQKHCNQKPVYGSDLHDAVNVWRQGLHYKTNTFSDNSAVHCYNVVQVLNPNHPRYYWVTTEYLKNLIMTPEDRLEQLRDVLER